MAHLSRQFIIIAYQITDSEVKLLMQYLSSLEQTIITTKDNIKAVFIYQPPTRNKADVALIISQEVESGTIVSLPIVMAAVLS